MIECDENGNPVVIKSQDGKTMIRGANGELIECDASGKPVIVKGPGGKTYIKGANGELIECDASGKPIAGGRVIKNEPGKTFKVKNGKVVFDGAASDDSDFDPDDPQKSTNRRSHKGKVKKRDANGNVYYEDDPSY